MGKALEKARRKQDKNVFDQEDFYISSDLHLGHQLVSELRGFATTTEHDDAILRQLWDLPSGSTFICLGDISVHEDAYALEKLTEVKAARDLTLILTPGNHDQVHPKFQPAVQMEWMSRYQEVFDLISLNLQIRRKKEAYLFNHYPALMNRTASKNAVRWAPHANRWTGIIHGHTHSPVALMPGHVNVAPEAHELRIIHSSKLWDLLDQV